MARLGRLCIAWDDLPAALRLAYPVTVRAVSVDMERLRIIIVLEGDLFQEGRKGDFPPAFSLEEIRKNNVDS